ncbi:P-loop containing nucleoside triphosphate hydrolase protein [Nemania diffusa]|nr:P-loop containing nucleoside triphosphate hydrolase protein [Nemania diffusa]
MPDDKALLASSGLALGIVAAFSIPAIIHLNKHIRNRTPKTDSYEDKDGQSTEEAVKAFSNKLPKASILVLSVIGLCISIATAVISTLSPRGQGDGLFLENWLVVPGWALLTFQAVCITASRNSVDAYNLGIYSMASCIAVACVLAFQDNLVVVRLWKHDGLIFAIRVAEIVTVLCLGFASVTIPRRPDVFYDGELVDRLYTVSAWSRYNWSWTSSVLGLATKKKNLDLSDLPRPNHIARSKDATAEWETHNFKHPLWISVILAHKWAFALQWAMSLGAAILNFAPQWVVLQLLHLLEQRQGRERIGYEGWMWAVWLMVVILVQSWIETLLFWLSWADICIPIRAQLSALIFQKAMRRKDVKEANKKKTSAVSTDQPETAPEGHTAQPEVEESSENEAEVLNKSKQSTVNLIGVDAKRVSDFANFNWIFPSSLFKLIVSLVFLLDLLGWKSLMAGFGTMLVVTPINIYFSKLYSDAQDRLMHVRDEKMGIVSEALQGIRQIKFSALEPQWEKKIGAVRERELTCVWDAFRYDVMLFACWITSPILLAAVSLAVYAALHGSLIPSVAFVSLSVFKALELTLSIIPELTTDLLDAWVSIKRIDDYLQGAEISEITQEADEISFDNASIAWPSDTNAANSEEDPDRFILRHVDVKFPKGELSVISGKTGSGKSLMLAAILGEVDLLSGTISKPRSPPLHERHDSKANKANWIIPGAVAYVAQIPWIENATVKDNILFGLPFDEHRYRKTTEVCALTKDIEMFSDGDETEIGANGINLSGGQKWRITLARAIYSRAGILVLDDIFSAVDAHVGRHIFEKCLNGEVGVGRTRILVTHHVALCESKTKYLIELGEGRVLNAGLLSELEETGTLEQIRSHEQGEEEIRLEQVLRDEEEMTAVNSEEVSQIDIEPIEEPLTGVPSKVNQPRKFVEEEKKEEGAIKIKVYSAYLKYSGSWPFWSGAVFLFLVVQVLTIGRSWWLRIWTGIYEDEKTQLPADTQTYAYQYTLQQTAMVHITGPASMPVNPDRGIGFYLGVYIALSVVASFLSTIRWYYIFTGSIRASRELFARLNFIILRAPLRWLDTVPVGRILNRFTADFHSVDTHLAYAVAFAANAFLNLLGVVVAGLFVSPVIIFLAFLLLSISIMFANQYLHAARSVKRMESITKSPVFEQFGSALTGVLTIRSFSKSQTYIERMYRRLDDWTVTTWHLWLFNRWMGWRMSVVGSFFASFVTFFILLSPDMDSALAGFALSFALEFSGYIMWTIRHYANAELEMNAAERIVEYTELPTEDLTGVRPPAAWPTEGRVEVNDLVVSYADDLPPVLKGLNFSVNRNERVGVIGRTGAGKSSLTLALFRFIEAQSGSILIDGLDISKIRLHDLRSRLAIIPQDPVLFSGTVRSNLDPFDNHTDAELFDSLARVHLISEADTSPGTPVSAAPSGSSRKNTNIFRKLSSAISEGGLNLSQGQRQLLCLARAIVSRPKVMVLDEATSAVDMATDALIQRSIREEFGDSTLVVIAHRLSTIADFDRILVLSDGRVAEYGTPRELWEAGEGSQDGDKGVFRAMCEQSGEREVLRRIVYGEDTAVGKGV